MVERDQGEESRLGGGAEAGFDEPSGFGDDGCGDSQIGPVAQQGGACGVTGLVAVGSRDEDARVDQKHGRTSDALSKLLAGRVGSLLVNVERLGPPGRAASDERFQGVIEPRCQLVEERLGGDPRRSASALSREASSSIEMDMTQTYSVRHALVPWFSDADDHRGPLVPVVCLRRGGPRWI